MSNILNFTLLNDAWSKHKIKSLNWKTNFLKSSTRKHGAPINRFGKASAQLKEPENKSTWNSSHICHNKLAISSVRSGASMTIKHRHPRHRWKSFQFMFAFAKIITLTALIFANIVLRGDFYRCCRKTSAMIYHGRILLGFYCTFYKLRIVDEVCYSIVNFQSVKYRARGRKISVRVYVNVHSNNLYRYFCD